ncbi:MAG: N-acetyltransferase [Planctomycetia bacterium]|nr:N-acetyltransferase [Planctomycetia bacterium]
MAVAVEPMEPDDWPSVRAIYLAGIATGQATFETTAPDDWQQWSAGKRPDCRLVARDGQGVVGGAALSPVSKRAVYAGVAEASVYVAEEVRGQGIGGALLAALIAASEAAGVWTLQAAIFPENAASLALVKRHGFREVGVRRRIAQHHGTWRDVILLERRSDVVGNGD